MQCFLLETWMLHPALERLQKLTRRPQGPQVLVRVQSFGHNWCLMKGTVPLVISSFGVLEQKSKPQSHPLRLFAEPGSEGS